MVISNRDVHVARCEAESGDCSASDDPIMIFSFNFKFKSILIFNFWESSTITNNMKTYLERRKMQNSVQRFNKIQSAHQRISTHYRQGVFNLIFGES